MELNELLDKAKEKSGIQSDYALAKRLHITRSAISGWRSLRGAPEPMLAVQIADLAGEDRFEAIALAEAARTADHAKRAFWMRAMSAGKR